MSSGLLDSDEILIYISSVCRETSTLMFKAQYIYLPRCVSDLSSRAYFDY